MFYFAPRLPFFTGYYFIAPTFELNLIMSTTDTHIFQLVEGVRRLTEPESDRRERNAQEDDDAKMRMVMGSLSGGLFGELGPEAGAVAVALNTGRKVALYGGGAALAALAANGIRKRLGQAMLERKKEKFLLVEDMQVNSGDISFCTHVGCFVFSVATFGIGLIFWCGMAGVNSCFKPRGMRLMELKTLRYVSELNSKSYVYCILVDAEGNGIPSVVSRSALKAESASLFPVDLPDDSSTWDVSNAENGGWIDHRTVRNWDKDSNRVVPLELMRRRGDSTVLVQSIASVHAFSLAHVRDPEELFKRLDLDSIEFSPGDIFWIRTRPIPWGGGDLLIK